jgi:hypothetical protein
MGGWVEAAMASYKQDIANEWATDTRPTVGAGACMCWREKVGVIGCDV